MVSCVWCLGVLKCLVFLFFLIKDGKLFRRRCLVECYKGELRGEMAKDECADVVEDVGGLWVLREG